MKWDSKNYKQGDTRIVETFLFFPKCINGEYRWLDFVKYLQEYWVGIPGEVYDGWRDIKWID